MPKMNYFVCVSHRSGSTLLCETLEQTGIAGMPGEYFMHWQGRSHEGWSLDDYPAYVQRLVTELQTPNGVFSAKVMTGDDGLGGVVRRVQAHEAYASLSDAEVMQHFFPNARYIYLTRRHKVAQAVSWWKAAQNDIYHLRDDEKASDAVLEYKLDAINYLLREIIIEESAHQAFFDAVSVVPLTVVYEDFVQDMEGTLMQILDYLDLSLPAGYEYKPSPLKKMADALSEEWIQRYRQEIQTDWQTIRW